MHQGLHRYRPTSLWSLPLAAALPATLPVAIAFADPPRYRVTPIVGAVGPSAINDSGTVVGTNSSPMRAWISRGGSPAELLPLPPGDASSWATDINDAGVVVGATSPMPTPEFSGKATAWIPLPGGGHSVEILGTLPGHRTSNATALNDVGDIVGHSSNGTYRFPVRFALGTPPQDLTATGIFDPQDVNDGRVVVDRSFIAKTLDLDSMRVRTLTLPGQGYLASSGAAINASGQVAGVLVRTSSSCPREAARWDERIGWQPLSGCRANNGAQDLNDRGDVVMTVILSPYLRIEGSGTYLIDDLIETGTGTWSTFTLAPLAINQARQIATNARNDAIGFAGAVLLSPVVEGDLDGDLDVDAADLASLLAAWGACPGCDADLDGDGLVGPADLAALLAAWTPTP
jgi:uncharacterized membrane protein